MRLLNLDEIKKVELKLLLSLDKICKENKLRYYIAYGTLIGACRHKGFIPWDDDIDVVMPREDYEKLMKIHGEGEGRYRLFSSSLGNMPAGFAKYRDINIKTKFKYIFKGVDDRELGIDIFPMDASPNNDKESQRLWRRVSFYRIMFDICSLRFRNKVLAIITFPFLFLFRLVKSSFWMKRAEKLAMSIKEKTDFAQNFIWGFDGNREKIPSSSFDKESVMLEFEGYMFPTFSCYLEFLKNMYGDWTVLPPESKRKQHSIKAWMVDEELGL